MPTPSSASAAMSPPMPAPMMMMSTISSCPSLPLRAAKRDNHRPFLRIGCDQAREIVRRAGRFRKAELCQVRPQYRRPQRIVDHRIELADDGARGAGGGNEAHPGLRRIAIDADLRQ